MNKEKSYEVITCLHSEDTWKTCFQAESIEELVEALFDQEFFVDEDVEFDIKEEKTWVSTKHDIFINEVTPHEFSGNVKIMEL